MLKECTKCHELKPCSEFYHASNGGLQSCCKDCSNKKRMKSYYDHAAEICAKNAQSRRKKGVIHHHVYQPVQPEGTYRKICDRCNGWIYVDPSEKVAKCPHCERMYSVSVKSKGVGLFPIGEISA